jgi:AbrB family looped-hinge helix DNA binding protein
MGHTMKTLESSMTQKGQITIPAEIRSRLGLHPRDRVRFELLDGSVIITPVPSKILRHFGTVEPRNRPEDWRAVRDEVEELMAADVVAEDA